MVGVLGAVNGKVLFNETGNTLWAGDGTAAGTVQLAQSVDMSSILVMATKTYFVSHAGGGPQPWVTDGTVAGTHLLKDVQTGALDLIEWLGDFNGVLQFEVAKVDAQVGRLVHVTSKLWSTDGTEAGTVLVGDISIPPQFGNITYYGSGAFTTSYGEAWSVHRLKVGQSLYFAGNDAQTGTELYAFAHRVPTTATDSASSSNDAAVTIKVLDNDAAVEGTLDPSSVKIVTVPQHGTVTVGAGGVLVYTPNDGFSGTDTFSYTVADTGAAVSAPTSVTVTVTSSVVVNSPTNGGGGGGGALSLLDALALICLYGLRKSRSYTSRLNESQAAHCRD